MTITDPEALRAALQEVVRRGREIISGERVVGLPRSAAFDLAGVAARALSQEIRGPEPVEQRTWVPPELREAKRKPARK